MAQEHATAHPSKHAPAVCDEQSNERREGEGPSYQTHAVDLERRAPSASRVDRQERTLEAICEVTLLPCLDTETVKRRTLWSWENGARLELSMAGRSKIGAVYRTTW